MSYAAPPSRPSPSKPSRNPFRTPEQREPPRPRPPMSISRSARAPPPSRRPVHKHHIHQPERNWETDLYDCMDPCDTETCMQATFCPCVVYGNNRRRYEHLQAMGYPHPTLASTKRNDHDHGDEGGAGSGGRRGAALGCGPCYPSGNGNCCSCPDETAQGQHHYRDGQDQHGREYSDDNGFVSGPCFTHAICLPLGVGLVLQAITRGHIRMRYRIKGDGCSDFAAAVCCGPCQLVQESRELEVEEGSFILEPVDVRSARPRIQGF